MITEETIIQIKETKNSNMQIKILDNSLKEEIRVSKLEELKKQIQNTITENELIHIINENKDTIFDKMLVKDYKEIKTIVSNKTFLSINFIKK
jgi:regulator of replication initiation timing